MKTTTTKCTKNHSGNHTMAYDSNTGVWECAGCGHIRLAREIAGTTEMKTENMTRREIYMAANKLHPDEIAGATELECELDLRGITGEGAYAIRGYCTQPAVARCSECSECNYGRDCHNNKIA